jgi:putative colanic acid biosynthesis glycosyltransferase
MKVLLIDVNCKHSSTGKIVYDLYRELNKQGHTASIAYGRGSQINEPNILKYGYDLETLFHVFMTRITGLTGYFSWFSTRRLLRHIKSFQPDIVHLHDLHGYHLNIGELMSYLKKHSLKTLLTLHSEFYYTGKCGHAKECVGFESTCGNCPLLREYPKSLSFDFTKFMLKQKKEWFSNWNNLILTTPSRWMKNRVKRSFLRDFPLYVIENGLDSNTFTKRIEVDIFKEYRNNYSKLVLSIIPNLKDPIKGYDWVRSIASNGKLGSFLFVVVTKAVDKKIQEGNLLFIPYLSNQTMLADIYSSVDIFMITSKYESFSMISLEAFSCGLPVVGFDVGGVSEAVQGNSEYLVPYGSADIIEEILSASKIDSSIFVIDKYKISSQRMLKEFTDVYFS